MVVYCVSLKVTTLIIYDGDCAELLSSYNRYVTHISFVSFVLKIMSEEL